MYCNSLELMIKSGSNCGIERETVGRQWKLPLSKRDIFVGNRL